MANITLVFVLYFSFKCDQLLFSCFMTIFYIKKFSVSGWASYPSVLAEWYLILAWLFCTSFFCFVATCSRENCYQLKCFIIFCFPFRRALEMKIPHVSITQTWDQWFAAQCPQRMASFWRGGAHFIFILVCHTKPCISSLAPFFPSSLVPKVSSLLSLSLQKCYFPLACASPLLTFKSVPSSRSPYPQGIFLSSPQAPWALCPEGYSSQPLCLPLGSFS